MFTKSSMNAEDSELDTSRMSFVAHLAELRKRILYSMVVVLAAMLACFTFAEELFGYLELPLEAIVGVKMIVISPLEMFVTYLKIALVAGIFVSAPWLLLQIWLFVAPGLYAREKRWIVPFIVMGTIFFVGGGAFAYFVVLPLGFQALVSIVPQNVASSYSVGLYFSFVIRLILAFGVVFELPLFMWIVSAAGIIDPKAFGTFRKYWVVAAVAIAAFLTPPDPFTQILMAVPLIVFYELGMIGAKLLYPKDSHPRSATA